MIVSEHNERRIIEQPRDEFAPGLARIVVQLRTTYPLLSEEAIVRILRMPACAAGPINDGYEISFRHHTPVD